MKPFFISYFSDESTVHHASWQMQLVRIYKLAQNRKLIINLILWFSAHSSNFRFSEYHPGF